MISHGVETRRIKNHWGLPCYKPPWLVRCPSHLCEASVKWSSSSTKEGATWKKRQRLYLWLMISSHSSHVTLVPGVFG